MESNKVYVVVSLRNGITCVNVFSSEHYFESMEHADRRALNGWSVTTYWRLVT